jgi:hypothetical protein
MFAYSAKLDISLVATEPAFLLNWDVTMLTEYVLLVGHLLCMFLRVKAVLSTDVWVILLEDVLNAIQTIHYSIIAVSFLTV